MNDKRKVLYEQLSKDYDLGDFDSFSAKLDDENKRKALYDAVSEEYELGDYDSFVNKIAPAKTYQPTEEEVQQRILTNKPDMFKPKTVDMYGAHDKDKSAFDLMQEGRSYDMLEANQRYNQRPITESGEAFKQGADALYQGGKNLVGETANVLTGSQRDYSRAKMQLEELVRSGYDMTNFDVEKALSGYKDREFQRRMGEWQKEIESRKGERKDMNFFDALLHRIQDPSRPKSQYEDAGMFADELQLRRSYHAIQDALQKTNGNVEEAYKLLSSNEGKETWGDKVTREAREELAKQRPTEGTAAWIGGMIPQMIGTGAGVAMSFTPWGRIARFLGQANMMALTGSTAGMSMAEARDYAERKGQPANEGDVWRSGMIDAAIEYGTERIPFNRYFNNVQDASSSFIGKFFSNAVKGNGNAKNELSSLLNKAAKDFKLDYISKDKIEEYLTDVVVEGVSELSAEVLQTLSPMIYQNPEDYPTLKEILDNGLEGAKGGLFMGAFLGGGSSFANTYRNRKRREKQGGVRLANTSKNGVVELLGEDEEGIHAVTPKGEEVILSKEDIVEERNYTLEEFENAAREKVMSDVRDNIEADNQFIDSVTDPSTGMYTEVDRLVVENGEMVRQHGYIVGWIDDAPVFLAEGLENTQENRVILKPNQWDKESMQQLPNDRVKAINEEMVREEAAVRMGEESKYAPEVLKSQMQQGVPFDTPTSRIVPISPMPEGNGWVVEEYAMDTENKVSKMPIAREMTTEEYRDIMQAQYEAQQAESAPSESVGEQVNTPVNTEVNNPMENTESTPMTPMETQGSTPMTPMSEEVQSATEEKSTQPVIPTKKDGSIDFVAYGREGTLKTLGEKYGEKLPNKVAVTAKALAEDVVKAEEKLAKAEEAYDNAPIGREQKTEQARDKARQELEEVKKEADYWKAIDKEIKEAQKAREAIVNPTVEPDMTDEPMTTEEFVAKALADGGIRLTSDSYKKELGYGEKERKRFPKMFAKKENGGLSIEEAGEWLMQRDSENGTNFFDQEDANAGRDALINFLGSVRTWGDITGYIKNNREQQANRDAEGLRNEIEEAIESNYHMTPEDYATLQEMESVENPFGALDVATKDAIFVEAYEEYEQSLNPKQNDEGRTSEIAEGNSDVLSEERTDNEGGTSERQGERPDVSEGTVQQNDAAQETEQVEEPLSIQEGESPVAFAERVLEEQRRKPLRKRIKEWAASGVKVNVIERLEDVPNKDALAAIEGGSIVPGWYESSSNEVYVYLPHVADLKDLDVTIIHEGLSHKGVRELLGEERFGELCDKVWDMMSRPDKDFYISYPGVNGNTRAAADEYIAHLAEKVNLTPEEQTIWDKIVKLFRDALDRALNGILTKSQITDADIAELIKMSYANLKSGAEDGVSGDGTRFRFSKTPQEFDAVQKEAVEKKGIVMPGLNEADVDVLSIHKHDFNGNLKQAREEAKQWAIENYQGKEFTLPEDGGLYTIGKKAINKYVDKTSIEKSDDAMIHLSALKELPNIISSSITGEIHADYKKGENGQRSIDNGIGDKGLLVHRMYGAIELDGKTYRVKTTMNEYRDPLASNTPHSYEVTEIELIESSSTPSLKDDSKPLNVSNNSITSANLLNGVEKSYDKGKKLLDESEKTRFRVVYHGSAADFDKFDHSKMGSGAGSQVFGWGTYLTESEKVGRDYGDVALQSENRFTYVGDKDVNKWTVADAEQIMHTAGSYEEAIKRYGNATLAPGTALEQAVTFLKSTKKEDWQGKRHLYEVEIPSEKHGNYIVYGNNVTDAAAKKVFDGIYKRLSQTEEYDNPTAKKELKRELDDLKSGYGQGQSGIWKDLYGDISSYLGSDKEASLFLRSLGYVGIKYPAGSIYQGDYGGASNYVIFDENDLKIVNHTRFRIANQNQEIFVSNAQKAVEGIKQEKGTPQQWLAMIEKNGGLKAGEDKWLGLSDWLKGLDKKSLTKAEIIDFIGENKIVIEEVHYGGKDMSAEDIKKTFDYKALVDDLTEYDNDGNPYISEEKYNYLVKETVDFKIGFKLVDGKLDIKNPFAASMYLGIAPKTIEGVRINYTTEGLENKAEIALTVPTIEPWNESDEIHFGDAGEGRAIAWIRFGETSTPNVAFINAREAVNNYIAEMREKYNVRGGGIYDVMNEDEVKHLQELTSAEFDTRDKVERVLVIDEIQSKRHQEGREKGYKSKEVDYLRKELEGLHEKLYSDGLTAEEYQRNREIQQRLREIGNNGTIPEAPFEKNWSELAMKRMLRYAAENGYDKVAWTTGAQQAERYNLSKFVDNIRCNRVGKNGNKSFVLEGIDYNVVANNEGLVVAGADEFKGKHLSEIVGSSLSDKMLGMEEGDVLNDTDLHIGGEGMKGFYDKMLPSFVNKYVKKWGTKVQDIELPNVEEAGRIMHSVDVTDAMKESVMQGQTMFRVKREDVQKQVDDFASKYNSRPVAVVDSAMSDEELSEAFDGKIDVNELRDFMNKSKSMGGFVRDLNKVVIFADKMKQGRMEESLFHENIHALMNEGNYTKLLAQFYEYAKDDETFSRWKTISENAEYKPYERAEEFFAYVVSNGMVADNLEDVLKYLDNERQAELNELLNKIGYNYDNRRRSIEESVDGRRAERVAEESVVSGDALQVSGASGKTGRGNGESEKGSPREKAEELRKLFERVASEGLRGVVGDAAYDMAMIDVYHALPEKERVEVSMNAVRNLGGNVAAAVDEYLEGKDKASLWDKVTGIIRDVLRKAGFDLDLTGNDVKYLLWRSKKPLDKDNLLDLAEDIDMRYRLKVGEYEGSPTENEDVYEGDDNAGVRFRVVTDASLIEELESSEKRIGYRNVVLNEDGSFGSPMADKLGKTGGGKKKTSGFEIGKWEQAEENPDLVDENGKIDLIKPDGKQIKKVDYNPYIHNRLNCVNRQFKQAWERPDLVYVETEIPMFDLESGYHADKAKKPVGEHKWNGGNLILSRYDKPVRIVGWEEVADDWEKAFKKKGVHFDIVPPALLPILVERGVKILPPHKGMGEDCNKAYQKFANNTPDGGGTRFRTKKKEKIDLADNRDAIIKKYDEELKSHSFNFQEAFQDRMLSVKVLMDLIEQETGKKARSFEDAYKAENQLGSINKPAQEKWLETFYKPLLEEMHKLTEKYGRKEVENYIYCKSGLERNEVLRQRDADEAYEEAKEELDSKLAKKEIDQAQYNTLLQMAEDQRKKTLSEDVDYSGIRGLLMNTRADELFEQYQKGTITESEYKQKVADLKKNEEQVIKDWKKFAENQVSYLENKASKNELNALWDKINAATNETLRIDFESGMIDRETYEAEKKMMKYYVPLRNWENTTAEEMYEYRHDMTPAVSSNQKRAKGRKTQADNPIATIALMAQNAIVRGNRNKMKINLYSFVVNRPTALASVRNVWYVKNANNKWEPQYADTSAASNQDEINQIMEQFELDMQQLAEQGKAFKGKIKQGMHFQASRKQKDEHVVTVMINGKEYGIYINGNPRAAQAINGMTNAEGVDDAGKWIDALKRYYGAGLTSWNPDFIIPNMVRDTIHATTMTFLDKGVIESAKYAWNVPKMFTQITKEVTGISTGDPKLHKYFEEFVKNGGETGYTAIHTLEDYKKEYERLVNEAKGVKSSIAKGGKNLIKELSKILEAANRIAEDVNRFNAYVTSRESGENIKNSIDAAKNITVNFNRKGALSANNTVYGKVASLMSRWILFFNPSVQGIHQLVTKSKANPKRAMSMGATILSSGFLVPMINEMLVAAFGGDDEDDYWNQSDYKRRNNLMLFAGDGYVSIPLPPVLRELYGMGDIMYGVITGHIPAQRAIYDTLKQIQSAVGFVNLLPEVSQEPDMITYAKGFAPDLAAPLLDVISNTNFMGRPIAKWTDYNEYDPEYMRVYKGVSPQWIELSKLLNEVGGNETRRSDKLGNFINPAMMEHLFTSYTGGIGKTINNLAGMIVDAATGNTENMDIFRKTPIIPRFYTPNDEKTVQPAINRKYYEFEYQYNNATKSLKKANDGVKNGEHPEWQKYIDEMEKNGEQEFIKYFKKEQKRLKKLQDKLKEEPNNKEYEKKVYDKKAEISLESFKILSGQDK